jgi:hypothetical protein
MFPLIETDAIVSLLPILSRFVTSYSWHLFIDPLRVCEIVKHEMLKLYRFLFAVKERAENSGSVAATSKHPRHATCNFFYHFLWMYVAPSFLSFFFFAVQRKCPKYLQKSYKKWVSSGAKKRKEKGWKMEADRFYIVLERNNGSSRKCPWHEKDRSGNIKENSPQILREYEKKDCQRRWTGIFNKPVLRSSAK